MGIVESPGIAYVINTNYGANMSTSLVNSVFASWPLALFSIFLAYIAGYVIWIMVSYICLRSMRGQGREVPRVSGKFLGYQISPRPLALFSIFLAYSRIRYLYSGKIQLS